MENKPILEENTELIEDVKPLEENMSVVLDVVNNAETEKVESATKKRKKKNDDDVKDCCKCESCHCNKKWIDVYKANYDGTSKEAKEVEPFLKSTYKGDVYVPWAVMERLTYMCDENAEFNILQNADGGYVFTDKLENHQLNIQKGETISETNAPMFAHFVKVELKFLGRVFLESYPIQEQDYTAARIYNQNLVNRAIKRAIAKVAARATGLALKLYEGHDLQFDSKEEAKPNLENINKDLNTKLKENVVKKEEKVQENKVIEEPKKVEEVKELRSNEVIVSSEENNDDPIADIINILRNSDKEKVLDVLRRINISIVKKLGFAISLEDDDKKLTEKLSKIRDVSQFRKTLKNLIK